MMPIQPLRFVLADDPGAGKTIMSGLYIRNWPRGDLERVLIVAPGSLVVQWQDELWQRFHLDSASSPTTWWIPPAPVIPSTNTIS